MCPSFEQNPPPPSNGPTWITGLCLLPPSASLHHSFPCPSVSGPLVVGTFPLTVSSCPGSGPRLFLSRDTHRCHPLIFPLFFIFLPGFCYVLFISYLKVQMIVPKQHSIANFIGPYQPQPCLNTRQSSIGSTTFFLPAPSSPPKGGSLYVLFARRQPIQCFFFV